MKSQLPLSVEQFQVPTRAAQVAAFLARCGIDGVTVERIGSAWYFYGASVESWPTRGVMVNRIGQLNLGGWLAAYRELETDANRGLPVRIGD